MRDKGYITGTGTGTDSDADTGNVEGIPGWSATSPARNNNYSRWSNSLRMISHTALDQDLVFAWVLVLLIREFQLEPTVSPAPVREREEKDMGGFVWRSYVPVLWTTSNFKVLSGVTGHWLCTTGLVGNHGLWARTEHL